MNMDARTNEPMLCTMMEQPLPHCAIANCQRASVCAIVPALGAPSVLSWAERAGGFHAGMVKLCNLPHFLSFPCFCFLCPLSLN